MMMNQRSGHSLWMRTIAALVVCLFLVNDFAFAIPQPQDYTLAPPTRFSPFLRIVKGIETVYEIDPRMSDGRRKLKFTPTLYRDKIHRILKRMTIDCPDIYLMCIHNAFDSVIDNLEVLKSQNSKGRIVSKLYFDNADLVIDITDNGKTIEFVKEGVPKTRTRSSAKQFGGIGWRERKGVPLIKDFIRSVGGTLKWYPLKNGTRLVIRIPRAKYSAEFYKEIDGYIVLENEEEKARGDEGTALENGETESKGNSRIISFSYNPATNPNRVNLENDTLVLRQDSVVATDGAFKLSTGKDILYNCILVIIQAFVDGKPRGYAATHLADLSDIHEIGRWLKMGKASFAGTNMQSPTDPSHPIQRAFDYLKELVPGQESVQYEAMVIRGFGKKGEIVEEGLNKIWNIEVPEGCRYKGSTDIDCMAVLYNGRSSCEIKSLKRILPPSEPEKYELRDVINLNFHNEGALPLQGVIFDSDGVLVDTNPLLCKSWDILSKENDGPSVDMEFYNEKLGGKSGREIIRILLGIIDEDAVQRLRKRRYELYEELIEEKGVKRYESTASLIRQLDISGVKLGVGSSTRTTPSILKKVGLYKFFAKAKNTIVTGEDVKKPKPDPEMFLLAAKRMAVEPSRTLVVGDSEADIKAGKAGGFGFVVGIDRGDNRKALLEAGADMVVNDLEELDFEKLVSICWDRELIRAIKEGEATGRQSYSGKHFVNSTVFYVISRIIGNDLYNPIELKKPVTPEAREKALANLIRENMDPVELAMSKTHHDPILAGFEIDKLRYNKKDGTYELPIYREGAEKLYYKFYLAKEPKNSDDWKMMPVGDGEYVYVRVKRFPEGKLADELSSLTIGTASVDDIDEIVNLWKNHYKPYIKSNRKSGYTDQNYKLALLRAIQGTMKTSVSVIIAKLDEKIIGYVMAETNLKDKIGNIAHLTVALSYRSKGVGTNLFVAALNCLKQQDGLEKICIEDGSLHNETTKIAKRLNFTGVARVLELKIESAKTSPKPTPADADLKLNTFVGDYEHKIIVKRNEPEGQVAMRVCEISEISKDERPDVIEAMDRLLKAGLFIKHANVLKIARDSLEKGDFSSQRIYISISDGELNGTGKINVEGWTLVQDFEVTTIQAWQINPNNFSEGVDDYHVEGVNPQFIGMGRQLLFYVVNRELAGGRNRLMFALPGAEDELEDEGLKVGICDYATLTKYIAYRSKKTLGYLDEASKAGDKNAQRILDELKAAQENKIFDTSSAISEQVKQKRLSIIESAINDTKDKVAIATLAELHRLLAVENVREIEDIVMITDDYPNGPISTLIIDIDQAVQYAKMGQLLFVDGKFYFCQNEENKGKIFATSESAKKSPETAKVTVEFTNFDEDVKYDQVVKEKLDYLLQQDKHLVESFLRAIYATLKPHIGYLKPDDLLIEYDMEEVTEDLEDITMRIKLKSDNKEIAYVTYSVMPGEEWTNGKPYILMEDIDVSFADLQQRGIMRLIFSHLSYFHDSDYIFFKTNLIMAGPGFYKRLLKTGFLQPVVGSPYSAGGKVNKDLAASLLSYETKSPERESDEVSSKTTESFSIEALRRLSFIELRERFRERRSKVKTQIIPDLQKIRESYGRYYEIIGNIKNEYEGAGNKLPTFYFAEDLHGDGPYAPSPLWFIAMCLKHMGIKETDNLLEVGSADGKLTCFIAHLFKNKTTGVETVPEYYDYGVFQRDKLIEKGFIDEGQVNLIRRDFTDESIDFSDYSIIYYYAAGTRKKRQLAEKFLTVKKGCRIVIHGQPETDAEALIALHPDFKMEIFELEYTGTPIDKKVRVYTRIADETAPKPASPKAKTAEGGLEELQNLWEDPRVIEMAKDLEKNGLKNFKKVDEKDVPHKMKNSRSGAYSGLYGYRNGLQIIKKRVKNIDVIKDFCNTKPAGAGPTFFVEGDNKHCFELELVSLGYKELGEIIHSTTEKVTPEMRVSVRQLIARDFRREENKWFRHGHLFPRNIFMKINKAGELEDIKIIDWKYLSKERPSDVKGFRCLVVEGLDLDGFDLTTMGLPAVLLWSSLKNANLRKTSLGERRLWFNDFRDADLRGAYLSNSDLWLSDLRGTDFRGAELSGTDFLNTLMEGTKFDKELGKSFEAKGFHVAYKDDYCLVTSPALIEQPIRPASKTEPQIVEIVTPRTQPDTPDPVQKMLDDAIESLKTILAKAKTAKLSRRTFVKIAATAVVSPGTVIKAGVAAANEQLLGEFFDLVKDIIKSDQWMHGIGGWYERVTNETIEKIKDMTRGITLPDSPINVDYRLRDKVAYEAILIEKDAEFLEILRKIKSEQAEILKKYLEGKADQLETSEAKDSLDDFTTTYWATRKDKPEFGSDEYEKARQDACRQIEAFPVEIRARAIYVMYKREAEDYRHLIKNVLRPAAIKLRSILQIVVQLEKMNKRRQRNQQKSDQGKISNKKPVTPESEQTHAVELAKTINRVQVKKETALSFIALGTNALYGTKEEGRLGRVAINPVISSIRNYCEKKGILFIDGDDDKVAQVVSNIKRDYKEARGIVLAGEKAIESIETYLKTIGLKDDKNILLAGLNNKNLPPAKPGEIENYIRLVEMLNLTIKLFHKDSIDEEAIQDKHPKLGFRKIHNRRITFEPDAEPMPYEGLRKIYELQEFA